MLDGPVAENGEPTRTCPRRGRDLLPIEIKDLRFVADATPLIDCLSLLIPTDGISLIIGPNGAGKSLLVRALHGLIEPSAGEIKFGGANLSSEFRQRQAMVFQRPVLLRRSTLANVEFALRLRGNARQDQARTLLDLVGLSEMADRPARRLSGGEQQRLALARALATQPDILFLDEPTANLDPASTKIIEDIVSEQDRSGTKIIFVTHDMAQARRLGSDVSFMHRGRVIETGSADYFFNAPCTREAQDYLAGRILI